MIRFGWGGNIQNICCARSIWQNLVVVGYHSKHLSTRWKCWLQRLEILPVSAGTLPYVYENCFLVSGRFCSTN
jgi:hypothetical protein